MSWNEGTFDDRLYDGKATPAEVEAYASGVAGMLLLLGVWCGHCKSYDPLIIELDRPEPDTICDPDDWTKTIPNPNAGEKHHTAHTYIFDLWDGGRHHAFKSLEQLHVGILASAAEWCKRHEVKLDETVYLSIIKRAKTLDALPVREAAE